MQQISEHVNSRTCFYIFAVKWNCNCEAVVFTLVITLDNYYHFKHPSHVSVFQETCTWVA